MRSSTSLRFAFLTACALSAAPAALSAQVFRTIDGSGNNPFDASIGAANTPLLRAAPHAYTDGLGSPGGATRPSARAVSNALSAQNLPLPNVQGASDMLWQWGQFLDHDLDLSDVAEPHEPFDIPVPSGDPFFDPGGSGTAVIALSRTIWSADGGGVRQQTNQISAWIDASNVYGADQARADELRTFDGTGRLKVTAHATGDLLPFNVNGFPNAGGSSDPGLFLAGDIRCNEQTGLAAMHTLWVREHNWLCGALAGLYPNLPGEWYYQAARALVIAQMQQITYEEFLPTLLGPGALPAYGGYDPNLDASIANEFSTASYRFGHSLLSGSLLRLDANGDVIPEGNLALMDAFFDPSRLLDEGGIDPLLRGLASQVCNTVDVYIVDDVRNFLFGMPGSGGFDLVSLNLQRGRDHGLADYNTVREHYGLARKNDFSEVSSDPAVVAALAATYASVDDVDPWIGGLAEDHLPGAMVGELVHTVLSDQFLRLREGDRYWYERYLPGTFSIWVERQTLSKVIQRNTTIGSELQPNVFLASNTGS